MKTIAFGLSQHIIDKILEVFTKHHKIERVVIFGSRALGNFKSYSDIDLAVYGEQLEANEFSRLSFELHELPIVFSIDVIHANQISNQALLDRVESEGQQIYPVL
ncbi:MAG: nucleotidyltransferase domain-containing protein [Deltaproteobacteria bacterium]|nr:nucleotidyltransferase domain-containing protein [Deltaproteobacteria bacterium]